MIVVGGNKQCAWSERIIDYTHVQAGQTLANTFIATMVRCASNDEDNASPSPTPAAKLPAFVKIGADSGHIEIELKRPNGESNLVIRRMLSAKSKSSTFMIGGKSASRAEDKVSAFAAISPVELLREAENAAGDKRLKGWHPTLVEAGTQFKEVTEKVTAETAMMRQLQERNENIERDVQRYRERKEIERNIALLTVLIPVQHYREARSSWLRPKA
ncbi:hypothetical protein B0H14DRAFT_3862292 [Mycena olivaceomarginata]|nr:hypothetical protein B0H14DRAFT_3862292 [Mycena olivaceomarginata]